MVTPIYFTNGRLLAQSGDIKVYLFNDLLHLEEDHVLWAIEDEIEEYKDQIKDYPHGDCLEIGLGIASRYILSCRGVNSLTTIEINEDTIVVQKQTNFIDDPRHTIVCMDGFEYLITTDKKYDFIFMDHYHFIDEEGLPLIKKYVEMCKKRVLKEGGKIVGWWDIYTPEEFIEPFYKIFE